MSFDVDAIRAEFPILGREVNGRPLVYLDNGASSQKPKAVVEALTSYYYHSHANVHRGVHRLSQEATDLHEKARRSLQRWLNAKSDREIIFTGGTTDGINLVASSFGDAFIEAGDEIIVSHLEHHSNFVPWQLLCERKGAVLRVIPVNHAGELDQDEYHKLLNERTKLVAVNHVSNALGTINPVKEMIAKAHARGAKVLIDGAQSGPHMRIDVRDLDADFYALSSHKMYGPTGIGVLYGKEDLLNAMPPYRGGGEMISTVTIEKSEWADLPFKFEAGTPNIADSVAFGAAIEWLESIDFDAAARHEDDLVRYTTEQLEQIEGLKIIGTATNKASVISFIIDGVHAFDVGTLLDQLGIAVRTGTHCTEPLMKRFGITGTIRASFAFYNTKAEADALIAGVKRALRMLS